MASWFGFYMIKQALEISAAERKKKNWIQGAVKKPGALHKSLDVPQGKKIPAKKLNAAADKGGKIGQRARFAETMKKINKKGAAACPGSKIRSEGKGRGMGFGKGKGPVGSPGKKRDWGEMLKKQRKRRGD